MLDKSAFTESFRSMLITVSEVMFRFCCGTLEHSVYTVVRKVLSVELKCCRGPLQERDVSAPVRVLC